MALHFACAFSNVKVVALLLKRGANPYLEVNGIGDAMACAERAVRREEVQALLRPYM